MERFFKKILFLAAATYVVFLFADGVISFQLYHSSWRPIIVLREILGGDINADVLVMGNSRAWAQIDPMALDTVLNVNSYNMGVDGSQINRQVQMYNMYRIHNRKPPEIIIQNIDAFSLYYTNKYQIWQFYPFLWKVEYRKDIVLNVNLPPETQIPFMRMPWKRLEQTIEQCGIQLYKGYKGSNLKWNGSNYRKTISYKFGTDDRTYEIFDSYLARCKEEGIKVVFVYAPMYAGAKDKLENSAEMYSTYRSFAVKYDIPILDYSDMWISTDTTYFYNAMHLNRLGAEIYSDSLAHGVKRLLSFQSNKNF